MDGVCADCWGVKDASARPLRRGRTEPLLDVDWNDPATYGWAALVVAAIVTALARLLGWL